jgi:hypothetical protein
MKTVSIFDRILNGCPVQIEKFASFLGSRLPTLSSMPRVSAGVKVIALNAFFFSHSIGPGHCCGRGKELNGVEWVVAYDAYPATCS